MSRNQEKTPYELEKAFRGDVAVYFATARNKWKDIVSSSLVAVVLSVMATMGVNVPPLISGGLAFVIAVVAACFIVWREERKKWRFNPVADHPHIFLKLETELNDHGSLTYRILVRNGNHVVENIKMKVAGDNFTHIDLVPESNSMLPPGGNLSLEGPPIGLDSNKYHSIAVQVWLDSAIAGAHRNFTSHHKFFIGPEAKKGKTFDPRSCNYEEGVLLKGSAIAAFDTQFGLPEGCIYTVLSEHLPNGMPNTLRRENKARRFFYDPLNRRVIFETLMKSGRTASLTRPIPVNEKMMHVVALIWKESGGSLRIDGDAVEDFDFETSNVDPKSL